jgi:hypothetical protein
MSGGIEGERPRVERTSQQPSQPENPQPQQGRAEGKQSLQGPTTFDGHEPEAYKRDLDIFKSRTVIGLNALREKVDRIGIVTDADAIAARIRGYENWRDTESDKGGRPFPWVDEGRVACYNRGLLDAFNLIVQHIHGKSRNEEPQGGLSQGGDLKK